MALNLPAPLVELGEVLIQWGEHHHVVKMPIRQANELDDAMLADDPNSDGLRGFIAGSYFRHSRQKCVEVIKKAFAAGDVTLSDDDLDEMQEEYGINGIKDLAVTLVANAVMGKKRLRELHAEAEKRMKELQEKSAIASSGAATTEPPLES